MHLQTTQKPSGIIYPNAQLDSSPCPYPDRNPHAAPDRNFYPALSKYVQFHYPIGEIRT